MAEAGWKIQLWRGRVGEVLLDTRPGQELHCAHTLSFLGCFLPPAPTAVGIAITLWAWSQRKLTVGKAGGTGSPRASLSTGKGQSEWLE